MILALSANLAQAQPASLVIQGLRVDWISRLLATGLDENGKPIGVLPEGACVEAARSFVAEHGYLRGALRHTDGLIALQDAEGAWHKFCGT